MCEREERRESCRCLNAAYYGLVAGHTATAGSIIERNAKCKRLNGHNGNECCVCVSAIITYMPIISYLVLFNLRLFDNRFNGIHVICLTCTCALCTRRKHFGIEAGLVWNLSRWYEMHRRHFAGGMFHITWREKWFENMPRSDPPRRHKRKCISSPKKNNYKSVCL